MRAFLAGIVGTLNEALAILILLSLSWIANEVFKIDALELVEAETNNNTAMKECFSSAYKQ